MKVLIIDDNPAVRTTLKLLLSDVFEEVATVGDPQLIPALLQPENIDAVLLDMNFDRHRFDGGEGLFWLSRIKEASNPPAVVVITAFGDVPLAVEAMKLGAEDFVTKPWDNDQLIAKIHNAIKKNLTSKTTYKEIEMAREIENREQQRGQMTLEEVKIIHIQSVIEQCGGNLSAAAEKLGINRQTLYNTLNRMKK
ncbi:MAG: response regulator [Bacteroides sp.]|nr:response regulator [Bacteroides sp.]